MPDEAKQRKPRRFRLKLQFSLQTMLIVTLAAALFCAWWLTPRLEEKTLGGGALKIRGQWAFPDPAPANSNTFVPTEPYPHGRWIMYDRQGRKLVDGRYVDGQAAGPWRYFDAEGRECINGAARRNQIDGQWTARHAGGPLAQQLSFTQRESGEQPWFPPPPPTGLNSIVIWPPKPASSYDAERTGTLRQEWDNGQPRVTGQFTDDLRAGKWIWFDRQGTKILEGTYHRGCKQGQWRRWDTPGGSPVVEYYAAGQRIARLDALLTELAADLQSGQLQRMSRAAWHLERLGSAAVPVLRQILRDGDCPQQLLAIRALQHIGPEAAAASEELSILAQLREGEAPAEPHSGPVIGQAGASPSRRPVTGITPSDLETAAGDARPRIQLNALLALAETDPHRAKDVVDHLLALATNEGDERQDQAIDSLTCVGPAGLRRLVAAVDDDRQTIRWTAFEAILRMESDRDCGEPLRGDPNVGTRQLKEVIRAARDHPDPKIRELAAPPLPLGGGGMF